LDVASYNLTVNDVFTMSATSYFHLQGGETLSFGSRSVHNSSVVRYYGTGTYNSLAFGTSYPNVEFASTGTFRQAAAITVNGSFTFGGGATFESQGHNLTIDGPEFHNAGGTYVPGTNTVIMGTNATQEIKGTNTFYNLTKTAAGTLRFQAGATQTVTNALTLTGSAGNIINLRSSTDGSQWSIDPQGSRTIAYLNVRDSNNTNAASIAAYGTNSTDSGNNLGWNFVGNSAPVAVADTYTVNQDSAATNFTVRSNDTDSNGDTLTITTVSNPPGGTATIVGGATIDYTPDAGFNGVDTFTYDISDGNGGTAQGTVTVKVMNPFTWTGAAPAGATQTYWTNNANWHGGAAPNSSQTAIFDGTCSANCSPTIDTAISVGGIRMNAGYGGTITTSNNVETYTTGLYIAAGTFNAASVGGWVTAPAFTQSGGTFTAPAGTLSLNATNSGSQALFTKTGGTFNHSSGSIRFYGSENTGTAVIDIDGSLSLNSVSFYANSSDGDVRTFEIGAGDTLVLNGDLYLTESAAGNGKILLELGSIDLRGSLYAYAPAAGGSTIIKMTGAGARIYTVTAGAILPNLEIAKNAGVGVTPGGGTTAVIIHDSLTITSGNFTGPTGTLTIQGYEESTAPLQWSVGAGLTMTNTTLSFRGQCDLTSNRQIDIPASLTVAGLDFGGGHPTNAASNCEYTMVPGDKFVVTGNLAIGRSEANGGVVLFDGAIDVQGNLSVAAGAAGGDTAITMTGTNAQTITQTAGAVIPGAAFTINKTSGTATLASALSLSGTGQDLAVSGGTFDQAGYNLTVNDTYSVASGATWRRTGGESNSFGTRSLNTASTLVFYGDQTYAPVLSGTGTLGHVIFDGPGTWNTTGSFSANDITINQGTWNPGAVSINIVGNFNHAGGTFTHGNSTLSFTGTNQTIYGNTTFYNLTKTAATARTLSFEAGSTQTIVNTLTLNGAAGQLLSLRSTADGTQWSINPQGTRTISYVDVKDSNNVNATAIDV
ncbi:MAG TPA: Ig-like domain-containing protein, partial [Bdellovibrionales bacterium]|nr:Ig-like domain-containing protein [Bdellovibrionales bacterium]